MVVVGARRLGGIQGEVGRGLMQDEQRWRGFQRSFPMVKRIVIFVQHE